MDMVEKTNDQSKTLSSDLIHDLHEQFAVNQNKHLEIFFGLVGSFVALFGALGYTYAHWEFNFPNQANVFLCTNFSQISADIGKQPYTTATLFGAIFIVNLLLVLMILLVTNFGWNFRRDQALNDKIRERFLLCHDYAIFFQIPSYGKNGGNMPDLYEIFFWFGLVSHAILYVFALYVSSVAVENGAYPICNLFLLIVLIPIAPFVEIFYYNKRAVKQFNQR